MADTGKYHTHLVKKFYSLQDALDFLSCFKPRFLEPFSANTEIGVPNCAGRGICSESTWRVR